ncbi:hypothetical protein HQ41_06305 [Porphyromonas sp. COT-290 OH860]|nr:hypothetical protein HQ41_06305 [Porphyromonas sp. COT-290 OH860]
MRKMQGAKNEAEGSILKYVTEVDDEVRAEQMSQATLQFVHYETPPFKLFRACTMLGLRKPRAAFTSAVPRRLIVQSKCCD